MLLDTRKNCPSCGMLAIPYKETGNEGFHNKLKGAAVSHTGVGVASRHRQSFSHFSIVSPNVISGG